MYKRVIEIRTSALACTIVPFFSLIIFCDALSCQPCPNHQLGAFVELDNRTIFNSGESIEDEIDKDIIRKAKKQLILMANDNERTMELIHTVLATQTVIQVHKYRLGGARGMWLEQRMNYLKHNWGTYSL